MRNDRSMDWLDSSMDRRQQIDLFKAIPDWKFRKHGLTNYKDTKIKCCHLKKFTCNVTLRQVFIRVFKQSVMLVYRPSFSPSNLLSDSPPFTVSKYSTYIQTVCDWDWLGGVESCWRPYSSKSIATLPPFGPIEGHKWFCQISSQWESQKNRFALISLGKIQFLPPCIWDILFLSYPQGRYSETGFHIWHGF